MAVRTLGILAIGVVCGSLVTIFLLPQSEKAAEDLHGPALSVPHEGSASEPVSVGFAIDSRLAAMEERLTALAEDVRALQHSTLQSSDSLRDRTRSDPVLELLDETERIIADRLAEATVRGQAAATDRQTEMLLAAGFTPARIDWIRRRSEEIQVEREAAGHELAHSDQLPRDVNTLIYPDSGLRDEMSDDEYERYLRALGRRTDVDVGRVLAGSLAEQAGIAPGDVVTSYNGKRVFSPAELNATARDRPPGEFVTVEVRRQGQDLQFVLPSGPLGIR